MAGTVADSKVRFFGDSAGIRTQDPYIKSVLLYQLSYGIVGEASRPAVGPSPLPHGGANIPAQVQKKPT